MDKKDLLEIIIKLLKTEVVLDFLLPGSDLETLVVLNSSVIGKLHQMD